MNQSKVVITPNGLLLKKLKETEKLTKKDLKGVKKMFKEAVNNATFIDHNSLSDLATPAVVLSELEQLELLDQLSQD